MLLHNNRTPTNRSFSINQKPVSRRRVDWPASRGRDGERPRNSFHLTQELEISSMHANFRCKHLHLTDPGALFGCSHTARQEHWATLGKPKEENNNTIFFCIAIAMALFSPADDNDWTDTGHQEQNTEQNRHQTETNCNNNQFIGVTQTEEALKIFYCFAPSYK